MGESRESKLMGSLDHLFNSQETALSRGIGRFHQNEKKKQRRP